jgi:DNA-binding transcriptional LysR family regulator
MNSVERRAMPVPAITIEQARALDALARHGTFAAAAAALRRGHTSVLYALRTLEDALGFPVLDRTGYRNQLTPRGRRVLEGCRGLLAAEAALVSTVTELRAGWEPTLGVVYDGIAPVGPLLRAVAALVSARVPTRISVRAEFLAGVEDVFEEMGADLMIAVVPPRDPELQARALPPLPMSLVARADHPLATGRHTERELREHLLITVRGSDPRLELPTAHFESQSTVRVGDFAAKREAILDGLGYGWLPDATIAGELARGRVARVRWARRSTHVLRPRLHHRRNPGPAAQRLIDALS